MIRVENFDSRLTRRAVACDENPAAWNQSFVFRYVIVLAHE